MYLNRFNQKNNKIKFLDTEIFNLAPWNISNYSLSLKNNKLFCNGKEVIFYHFQDSMIINSKIIIMGLSNYYVNINPIIKKLYLKCLKKYNPYKSCEHFPYPSKDSSYINFINTLKSKSKSILFVCHSSSNVKIINSKFPNSKVLEFKNISLTFKDIIVKKNKTYKYYKN